MDVKPFRGYRYDRAIVADAGRCVAPPYDVIDDAERQRLYDRSDYNIVRIDAGRVLDSDGSDGNVYTRAAEYLGEWIAQGALRREDDDVLYAYAQDFYIHAQAYRRTGFIGLGRLEPYGGGVRPHEKTLSGPKKDRLALTRAIKAQIGQVFMLYDDPSGDIDAVLAGACQGEELVCHEDEAGVVHRLFAVRAPEDIGTIVETIRDKEGFIADGHHRYETALAYWQESENPAAQWQMMSFVNTHNEGLIVLPTHRLVHGVKDFCEPALIRALEREFDIARLDFDTDDGKAGREEELFSLLAVEQETHTNAIGMYFGSGAFYVATLRDTAAMAGVAPDHSPAWRHLDVAVLHRLVLEKHLGIDEASLAAETHVRYIKDLGSARWDAIHAVDAGQAQGLFFLNPTRPEEVEAVAAAGERMPQKSTFFYPKVFSGLVLRRIEQ